MPALLTFARTTLPKVVQSSLAYFGAYSLGDKTTGSGGDSETQKYISYGFIALILLLLLRR
jgi:hypothetical protein